MDLNFLTGNPTQNAGSISWLSGQNNQNFTSPAMAYNPGQSLGMDFTSNASNTPALNGVGGAGSFGQLGMNIPTFQLGLGALGSLANIYGGFQANRLAKDQLSFTKDITNTNLNNSIKSYNTALEDRARSRAVAENRDQSTADESIENNKLSR